MKNNKKNLMPTQPKKKNSQIRYNKILFGSRIISLFQNIKKIGKHIWQLKIIKQFLFLKTKNIVSNNIFCDLFNNCFRK